MREVGEGGVNTKTAIINYHHRAAATGVGWVGVSLTKDQFVTALMLSLMGASAASLGIEGAFARDREQQVVQQDLCK